MGQYLGLLTEQCAGKQTLSTHLSVKPTIRAFGALLRDPCGGWQIGCLGQRWSATGGLEDVPFTANVGDVRVLKFQVVPIVIPRP
jgi:hypothetical protein